MGPPGLRHDLSGESHRVVGTHDPGSPVCERAVDYRLVACPGADPERITAKLHLTDCAHEREAVSKLLVEGIPPGDERRSGPSIPATRIEEGHRVGVEPELTAQERDPGLRRDRDRSVIGRHGVPQERNESRGEILVRPIEEGLVNHDGSIYQTALSS